ncbi:MAG: hypothetical protein J6K98_04845 [Clostridia bacterium]|nr:hypothetical protein [Clostridia bacterium]
MNYDVEITDLKRRETVTEHRLQDLEADVRDIRELTQAVAVTAKSVERLQADMGEVKADVKAIAGRSGKIWDKVVVAAVCAVATGLVAAVIALVLR